PQQPPPQKPLYPPPQQDEQQTRERSQSVGGKPKVDTKSLAGALLEKFHAIKGDYDKYHALNPDPYGPLAMAHLAFTAAVQRGDLQAAAAELRKLRSEIRKAQFAEDRRQRKEELEANTQQITERLSGRAKLIKAAAFQQGVGKKLEKELAADKHPTFKAFFRK